MHFYKHCSPTGQIPIARNVLQLLATESRRVKPILADNTGLTISAQSRRPRERWSTISCVHDLHTSAPSNPTKTGAERNLTPRPSSTRSSILACKRIYESVVQVSHIGTRLKKWWNGFIFYRPTPHMQGNIHGRVMLVADVKEFSLTPGSRRRSGRWESRRLSSRIPKL